MAEQCGHGKLVLISGRMNYDELTFYSLLCEYPKIQHQGQIFVNVSVLWFSNVMLSNADAVARAQNNLKTTRVEKQTARD